MDIVSGLLNRFYMPVCRYYSRYFIKNRPADSVYRLLCSIQFVRTHGYWPDFLRPKRFTEKLWSRMLHDRSDWLPLVLDKERVRSYVEKRIGLQFLVPILWNGDDPEMIPFDTLPSKYVIKATHGSGYNIIVRDRSKLDRNIVVRKFKSWMRTNYCNEHGIGIEWGYRNIMPKILIESFIGATDEIPEDFKFYCFSGRVEFLTRHFNRFSDHQRKAFDREYRPHRFRNQYGQYDGECPRPQNYDAMVKLAERLAMHFGFIRVDLYNINGVILFGELTPYPGGVLMKVLPEDLDKELGGKWALINSNMHF